MKAAIFYFSETGNTEKIAVAIYEQLQSAGYAVEPLLLPDLAEHPGAPGGVDLLGVGFPTFFGYPPRFVSDALRKLPRTDGTAAFVFTTYGGITAGDSLYEAASILAERGYRILGGLKIEGSDSYPQGLAMGINKGRPDCGDIAKARTFADRIAEAHRAGRSIDPKKLASKTPFFVEARDKPRAAVLRKMRGLVEEQIGFDESQCIFCTTCIESCPTGSIKRGKRAPEFSWKCINGVRCYQCVRVCPGKALAVVPSRAPDGYGRLMALVGDSPGEKKRDCIVAGIPDRVR